MEAKYKIAEECGQGFMFEGRYFTRKQAQRLADNMAKKKNRVDFGGKKDFWHGIVAFIDPFISMKSEAYFRINIAGQCK